MALSRGEKLSWFQRIRRLILGKEKPNLITRISVGAGFLIWVYLISWYVLTLLSILLMGSLKQADLVQGSFNRVGSKLYGYSDTINRLTLHTVLELLIFGVVLIGLILIYRKKRIGFLMYVIGNVAAVLATIFILGLKYFQYETSYTDLIVIAASTLYFGIGAIWFYKIKPNKEEQQAQMA